MPRGATGAARRDLDNAVCRGDTVKKMCARGKTVKLTDRIWA